MKRPHYPWNLRNLLNRQPTVGWLMDLCDENYFSLLKLAPELRVMEGHSLARTEGGVDLSLEVLEQTPYTTQIRLTHLFSEADDDSPDPDVMLRVYYDSNQVEVLNLRQRIFSMESHLNSLEQKWKVNLFLSKWLRYCVQQGYRFGDTELPLAEGVAAAC